MPDGALTAADAIDERAKRFVHPARFLLRCCLLAGLVLIGLLIAAILLLDWSKLLPRERIAQRWSANLLRVMNLQVRLRGDIPEGAALVVANHVSWLDIPVILSQVETRFVSKSEVRRWPVAGWLADAAGTFYIRRGSGASRPLLNRLSPYLAGGGKVCIFPEGTTTDGTAVLKFHARMFCAAIESAQPVLPLALRYDSAPNGDHIAPFIGDDDLFSHLIRVLRAPSLGVEITVNPLIQPEAMARAELSRASRQAVCTALRIEADQD